MNFPIYTIVKDVLLTEENGLRLIFQTYKDFNLATSQQHYLNEQFVSALLPTDIVFISLYKGHCGCPGSGTQSKLPQYEYNIDIIKQIAPNVAGIMVGNALMELSFRNNYPEPEDNIKACCDFILETADIIKSAGGTPVYGPINQDVGQDCYICEGRMKDTLNSVGAMSICFCGIWLFQGKVTGVVELAAWPHMRQYLHSTHMMSGVNYKEGLEAGNPAFLEYVGFKGGVLGES